MTQSFRVRSARLGDSQVDERLVVAPSEAAVREQLKADGRVVLNVQSQHSWKWLSGLFLGQLDVRPNYPLFCQEIRTLIQAGMTVVEAVDTLCARHRLDGKPADLPEQVLTGLQSGQALSTALQQLPGAPPVLIAAVQAGERTSNLAEALDEYLRYDDLVAHLRRKIVNAAIYPALVCAMALAISLFLLIVVIPRFAQMYENLRGSGAATESAVIALSRLLAQHQTAILLTMAVFGLVGIHWITRGGLVRLARSGAQAVPWLRRQVREFDLAMFYQALALLVRGGYPLVEATAIASRSSSRQSLQRQADSARAEVERGRSVAASFSSASLCDEVGRRLIAAAERNGEFSKAAEVVGRMHAQRFELFVERTTRVVEPVLLLGVTLLVGAIVIVMYQPVFDMALQLR